MLGAHRGLRCSGPRQTRPAVTHRASGRSARSAAPIRGGLQPYRYLPASLMRKARAFTASAFASSGLSPHPPDATQQRSGDLVSSA